MKLCRLLPAIALLAVTACGGSPPAPPQSFPPLDYSYLAPIVLQVANVNVVNQYVPDPGAATLLAQDPEAPAQALTDMLNRRLVADGTPGTATATIEAASIDQADGNYTGTLTVRVDVRSLDGLRAGYTEASVTHSQTAPNSDASPEDTRAALYSVTKQLMDAMNVQLQYQIQQNLGSWVSANASAAVPPLGTGAAGSSGTTIQATPLGAPIDTSGDLTGTPASVPGSPPVGNLATPTLIPPAPPAAPPVSAPPPPPADDAPVLVPMLPSTGQ